MACKVGAVLYVIVQFIAFVLVVVGTPFDMFRTKNEDTWGNTNCLTMWGEKKKCYSTTYDERIEDIFAACPSRRDRFRAAEAFAIISIAVYLVALLLGFIRLCCCSCLRWICLVLTIVGFATACVVWALMVEAFYSASNDIALLGYCSKYKTQYKFGAGFALFVAGFGLEFFAFIFLLLPC